MIQWIKSWFRPKKKEPDLTKPPAPWVQTFFEEAKQETRYSPDMPELHRREWHWYFSCDETQEGHHQEILMKNAIEKEEGDAFTLARYMMLNHDRGIFSHPLIFEDDLGYKNAPKMLQIKGELYKLPPEAFYELDKYRQNTVFCSRRLIPIVMPYETLMFKDREVARRVLGMKKRPILNRDGSPKLDVNLRPRFHPTVVDTNFISRPGMSHYNAWVYISSPSYWEDYLDLNSSHPPVRSFHNKNDKALVKEYYRYTDLEYKSDKGGDPPPWE